MSSSRARTVFSSPGVTEPDATSPSPVAIGPRDAPPHAGQVVRRVLLRRNIVIDAETAARRGRRPGRARGRCAVPTVAPGSAGPAADFEPLF